ncbi:hypothetical protein [Paenibacillus gansuensis]|uniref:DUF4825 domain-containing protein n=1 Tax=Paenibacillus gansuensis TaxID=306542 RepID=A0ABW5PD37_9BACL
MKRTTFIFLIAIFILLSGCSSMNGNHPRAAMADFNRSLERTGFTAYKSMDKGKNSIFVLQGLAPKQFRLQSASEAKTENEPVNLYIYSYEEVHQTDKAELEFYELYETMTLAVIPVVVRSEQLLLIYWKKQGEDSSKVEMALNEALLRE